MRRILSALLAILMLTLFAPAALADESDGDLAAFCPFMSTSLYNSMIKSLLELDDTTSLLVQVTSDGVVSGNIMYSNLLRDTVFIFGTTSEYATGSTAYIRCSLKDSSPLKNIPMLVWASIIQMQYYGGLDETGSSFLEWVNTERRSGDTFTSPYFYATYTEEPGDNCTLLLIKL